MLAENILGPRPVRTALLLAGLPLTALLCVIPAQTSVLSGAVLMALLSVGVAAGAELTAAMAEARARELPVPPAWAEDGPRNGGTVHPFKRIDVAQAGQPAGEPRRDLAEALSGESAAVEISTARRRSSGGRAV